MNYSYHLLTPPALHSAVSTCGCLCFSNSHSVLSVLSEWLLPANTLQWTASVHNRVLFAVAGPANYWEIFRPNLRHSKSTDIYQAQYIPDLGGSCAVVGGCCCCTGTASGCVPRLRSQPSCAGSLWQDSCKQPLTPPQAELREVSEYVPWTLDLCKDNDHKSHQLVTKMWKDLTFFFSICQILRFSFLKTVANYSVVHF